MEYQEPDRIQRLALDNADRVMRQVAKALIADGNRPLFVEYLERACASLEAVFPDKRIDEITKS